MFLRILAMWIRRRRNVTYLSFRRKLTSYFMIIKSCRGFPKPTVYILRTWSIKISSLSSHSFSLRFLNFRLFWRTVRTSISSFWNSSSRILSSCILLRRLSTSLSRHNWTVFLCRCFLQSTRGLVYFSIYNIVQRNQFRRFGFPLVSSELWRKIWTNHNFLITQGWHWSSGLLSQTRT